MAKGDFIIKGDDGKLYRVSRQTMFANPVAPNDPVMSNVGAMASVPNIGGVGRPAEPFCMGGAMMDNGQSASPSKNG